ncbi:uncharacterized protein LOC135168560 [Diachasmimorpha longicaudata]|uniref:uncharacterized protein LOC135168560 n=1 Tax=Diachasmimorpha longicaudata TaxID=58733 RepID=UPI0030B8C191
MEITSGEWEVVNISSIFKGINNVVHLDLTENIYNQKPIIYETIFGNSCFDYSSAPDSRDYPPPSHHVSTACQSRRPIGRIEPGPRSLYAHRNLPDNDTEYHRH